MYKHNTFLFIIHQWLGFLISQKCLHVWEGPEQMYFHLDVVCHYNQRCIYIYVYIYIYIGQTHIPDYQAAFTDGRGLTVSSVSVDIKDRGLAQIRRRLLTAALTTVNMIFFLLIVVLLVAYFIAHRIFVQRKTFAGTAKLYGKTVIVTGWWLLYIYIYIFLCLHCARFPRGCSFS